MAERLCIVFSGMLAGDPHQGGATWAVLQYVLGLRRLGHDVVFVEPVKELTGEVTAYFDAVIREFDLAGRAALVRSGARESHGISYEQLLSLTTGADLLLNVSGMLDEDHLLEDVAVRAYLDLDPAFNQLWHEVERI